MADSNVPITPGTGDGIATFTDSGGLFHQKLIIETQSGTADPVKVNAANPLPVGGTFNTSAPTFTNGQVGSIQIDANGNLKITGTVGVSGIVSFAESSTDGATFTRGTSPDLPVAGVAEASNPTLVAGKAAALSLDLAGNTRVNIAAGGAQVGTAGSPSADVLTIQGEAGMTPVQIVEALQTSGGASYSNTIAPGTPSAVTCKSSPGNVYGITAMNMNATPVFLKFWDTASAPTLGTTPATYQFMIPGNTGGAGAVLQLAVPRSHANRIYYAVTGGIAFADNTSIAGNSVLVDVAFN